MAAQEAEHRAKFDALIAGAGCGRLRCSRSGQSAGFALGAATALLGPKAAMACTAAIETEIDRHYTAQLDELGDDDPELGEMIREFRDDERAHKEAALCRRGGTGAGLSAALGRDPAGLPPGDPAVRTDLTRNKV